MPLLGTLEDINLGDNMTYWQNRSLDQETASVGLFTTTLLNGIKIEITSSNHSAFIRYTFPSASSSSNTTFSTPNLSPSPSQDDHILIDLTHALPAWDADAQPYSQKFLHGSLHIRPPSSSYFGTATYTGGWSQPDTHTLHFCGNFSAPPTSAGTLSWPHNPATPPAFAARPAVRPYADVRSSAGAGMGLGALFSYGGDASGGEGLVLEARVGVSYKSPERACAFVAEELPADRGFGEVVERARGEWEERVLGAVEVGERGNGTLMRMLYSALYQTGLMPTDKTGEDPWEEGEGERPYFDDHYVSFFFPCGEGGGNWGADDAPDRRCGTRTAQHSRSTTSSTPRPTPAS